MRYNENWFDKLTVVCCHHRIVHDGDDRFKILETHSTHPITPRLSLISQHQTSRVQTDTVFGIG